MELQPPEPIPALTSTTAPGKFFASRSDLQSHYKSDWHRYNLKRREAGLPLLNETDFNLRLEAALALRKEREGREARSGVDHRKDKGQRGKKEKKKSQGKGRRRPPAFAKRDRDAEEAGAAEANDVSMEEGAGESAEEMDEEPPEINPSQCPFDARTSTSPAANLAYMQQTYSFFLPDAEYCTDLEGFLGYCNEKVRWGNLCLYCQKMFTTTEAVVKHMQDKRHCKILYERGVDMEEFEVFYDFSRMEGATDGGAPGAEAIEEGDEEEWEDASDDEGEWEDASMDEGDDALYDAYQSNIASRGFDITPLGELVFPDGRIVGHRGLARYYKQRFAPDRCERAAVRHAKEAAGDRLYAGRVVNVYQLQNGGEGSSTSAGNGAGTAGGEGSTALATMGRLAGCIPTGRSGKGILVSGEGKGGFTSLSLYRYRAAVKKQRREDAKGQRLQHRSRMNMNKMDKKGNTRATGVVTALNPR
ncbi:hypothetical protein ACHAXT_002424 [Thalassiosira profunda]